MNELPIAGFQTAIKATHGADAELAGREYVVETFQGEEVWRGEVLEFVITGHPDAQRVFAWEVDGRVTAVLAVGPIKTARDAVKASILAAGEV